MDTPQRQGRREPRTVGLDAHPDSFTAAIMAGKIPLEAEVLKVSQKLSLPTLPAGCPSGLRGALVRLGSSGG